MPPPPASASALVDTIDKLQTFLGIIATLPANPPLLYLDLEGAKLSRHGTVAIIQVHVLPTRHTYLLDATTLQQRLFSTPSAAGRTLQDTLQDAAVPKVLFDCRNDKDALYARYGVAVRGVHDVQLMELATRASGFAYLNGLRRCIELHLPLAPAERGARLFDPKLGGSYEVFARRPLPAEIEAYCVADAEVFPRLWRIYRARLSPLGMLMVRRESAWRVERSKAVNYQPHGPRRAYSGWPWTAVEPPC